MPALTLVAIALAGMLIAAGDPPEAVPERARNRGRPGVGGGMNVRAERFPLFDGLRAIAALSVLVYHAAFFAAAAAPAPA